ncbi:MAG TPA: glycosyltransferase family 87 protein [Fimbriiglobus sp.]|jgi:hypothetical protein
MTPSAAKRWAYCHRYFLALAVALLSMAVPFFFGRKHSEWHSVFVAAGSNLLAGNDIFTIETGYTYPPFQALLASPFFRMPVGLAAFVWYAVNAFSLVWLLRSAWRLSGGGRLDGEPPAGWREEAVCFLGLSVGGCFLFHAIAHQQTDIIVSALAVGGCEFLSRGRGKTAGVLIGLAAAMKCTPLLFAPYLILKRRFAAAACLLAAAVGVNFLPDLVSRPADGGTWLGRWYTFYLAPMARPDYAPGIWASDVIYNQSLSGAAGRWTRTTWHLVGSTVVTREVPPVLDPVNTKRLILLVSVGLCGLAVIAGMRRRESDNPAVPPRIALECGIVFALMLLLSPMSSIPHSITMLLPGFVMARMTVIGRSRVSAVILGLMIVTALTSNKDLLGPKLYTLGLWYGGVMGLAAAAFAGGVWGFLNRRESKTSQPDHEKAIQDLEIPRSLQIFWARNSFTSL